MSGRRFRFVWLYLGGVLVVALTPLAIFGATTLAIERRDIEEQVVRDQGTGVNIVAEAFERHYVAKVRALEAFATRMRDRPLGDFDEELERLREPVGAYVISAHDPHQGHTTHISPPRLTSGKAPHRPSIGHRPYFQQAVTQRRTTASPLLRSATGVPIIAIAAPIADRTGVRTVVVMVLDLAGFNETLTHTAWSLGRFFLADRDGKVYHLRGPQETSEFEATSLIAANLTDPEGSRRIRSGTGESLISWAPIPSLGVTLGAEIAWRDVIAERRTGRAEYLIIATLGALALSGIAALIVGGFADRRLHAVRDYLQALAGVRAGTEPPAPPALPVDELMQITETGRAMAQTILSREQALRIVFELDRALAAAHTTSDIVRIAARHATDTLGCHGAAAFLVDQSRNMLSLIETYGLPARLIEEITRVPFDRSVAGRAIAANCPIPATADVLEDTVGPELAATVRAAGFQMVVATPCAAHGRTHGAVTLYYRDRVELDEPLRALLHSIGTQVGMAMAFTAERQQLVDQERLAALGRLAAGIGHELKNPLTVIDARIEMLNLHVNRANPEAITRDLASLSEASARMKRIMAGLSNYARAPQHELRMLDVGELLRGTNELVAYQARRTNVSVAVDVAADLPHIRGERSQLTQILVNLATNAIEAMADGGGTLTLRGLAQADRVMIEVADTGPGIPPERLDAIWTAFYTTKAEGTGLGLSIVRGLVLEQPDATIAVRSEVGRGTVFALSFPAVRDDEPR